MKVLRRRWLGSGDDVADCRQEHQHAYCVELLGGIVRGNVKGAHFRE